MFPKPVTTLTIASKRVVSYLKIRELQITKSSSILLLNQYPVNSLSQKSSHQSLTNQNLNKKIESYLFSTSKKANC